MKQSQTRFFFEKCEGNSEQADLPRPSRFSNNKTFFKKYRRRKDAAQCKIAFHKKCNHHKHVFFQKIRRKFRMRRILWRISRIRPILVVAHFHCKTQCKIACHKTWNHHKHRFFQKMRKKFRVGEIFRQPPPESATSARR